MFLYFYTIKEYCRSYNQPFRHPVIFLMKKKEEYNNIESIFYSGNMKGITHFFSVKYIGYFFICFIFCIKV